MAPFGYINAGEVGDDIPMSCSIRRIEYASTYIWIILLLSLHSDENGEDLNIVRKYG